MASKLGGFVVQHQYAVSPNELELLLELLGHVREWLYDLGIANYELWQDSERPGHVNEVIVYDSWSHYMRLNQKTLSPKLKEVYDDLSRLIDGGFESVQTRQWEPLDLGR